MKDFYNDNDVKFEYDPDSNKYSFDRQIIGATAGETLSVKDYTDTDANTIYVDGGSGSDANSGTAASPKVTILAAINACTSTKTKVIVANSQTFVEDVSGYSNAYFEQLFADTAITAILDRRLLGFTPADANSIFFNSTTGTTGGTGTAADPYSTIAEAVAAVDATHQAIVCQGSETYEEPGITFTGNFLGMYAAQGQTPTFNPTDSSTLSDYTINETVFSETAFATDSSGGIDVSRLNNGNFVIAYGDNDNSDKGTFKIYNELGVVQVSATIFHDAAMSSPIIVVLANDNIVFLFDDSSDGGKGKFVIWNESGSAEQVSAVTLNSNNISFIYGFLLNNGNFVTMYRDSDTNGKFIIYSPAGAVVTAETTFASFNISFNSGAVLDNDNFVLSFTDNSDGGKGKFVIWNESGGAEQVSATLFANTNVDNQSIVVLNNTNFMIAYVDDTDSDNGKFVIWNEAGSAEQVSAVTFSSNDTALLTHGAVLLNNTDFAIVYSDDTSTDSKFCVYNESGGAELTSTQYSATDSSQVRMALLANGDVVFIHNNVSGFEGSYVIRYLYGYTGLKISSASTINGWILDGNDADEMNKLVEIDGAKITLKYCNLIDTTNPANSDYTNGTVVNSAIYGDDEFDIDNCIIADNGAGVNIANNTANIQECAIYRNNASTSAVGGYGIHIDGTAASSGDITIEHCTLFNNYGGIRLESNGGTNEILKNLIIHGNDQYGIYADTAQAYSYSINTDSNTNASAGTNVLLANPLFINEGAVTPGDIDLQLKMRVLGYSSDSPAYLLGDDSRDAGCYWPSLIGSSTTWTSFTVEKPPEIKVRHQPVGAVTTIRRDGSIETSKEAFTEYVEFIFPALFTSDYENILLLFTANTNQVRIYPDPTTSAADYDTYKLDYKKSLNASAEHFRLTETGVANLRLIFGRAYS